MAKPDAVIRWMPQERQKTFFRAMGLAHVFEGGRPQPPLGKLIGYGGAAGGGKSDSLVVAAIAFAMSFANSKVGYFRLSYTQLSGPGGPIMRMTELLAPLVKAKFVKYNGTDFQFTFLNGSVIKFGYADRYKSVVTNYQGLQFDMLCFDEATHQTWDKVAYLYGRLRATNDNVIRPFVAFATNPGGVGHSWFKELFVDSGAPEEVHEVEIGQGDKREKVDVMFIPAKLTDNRILMDRDPDYEKSLRSLPDVLRRQLLEGDWDILDGVAFSEWRREHHVCKAFEIPEEWTRFTSLDWGYAKPYAVGYYAIDHDGRMWKYREIYGWNGKPDQGAKHDPELVARQMREAEEAAGERISYRVADDAIFGGRQDNSPSIAEQFAMNGIHWMPVGKGRGSRISGKVEMHHRLKVPDDPQERPLLVIFDSCPNTIRTIPVLMLDSDNPEDVDTDMEDHSYDETRYACMSRPIAAKKKEEPKTAVQKHKQRLIDLQQKRDQRQRRFY